MFPIRDIESYTFYKRQQAIMWVADKMDWSIDAAAYAGLPRRYRDLYGDFLAFFAPGDGVVSMQVMQFIAGAEGYEEFAFLTTQLYVEQVHSETYGRAIESVVPDGAERRAIFEAVDSLPCVRRKAEFVMRYCEDVTLPRGARYLAGAFAEGVFFAALFALVFFFRRKNAFVTFCEANRYILRDETLHRDYNCMMARRLGGVDAATAHNIAREAFELEADHLRYILREPVDSVESDAVAGLTVNNVLEYLKTLVDQALVLAGQPLLFSKGDDGAPRKRAELPWMADIGLQTKENFYETEVTSYSSLSVKEATGAVFGEDDF